MNVLGIAAFGENPAACLLVDGRLVALAEEERFTRLKVSVGMFPSKAVAYCLHEGGLTLGGIDRIAFGWDVSKYPWRMLSVFGRNYLKYKPREWSAHHVERDGGAAATVASTVLKYHPDNVGPALRDGLRAAGLGGTVPPTEYVPHHLAHAYSSYFCSGFERAGILTIDGSGEEICTQTAVAEHDSVRVVESFPLPHSLGWFYAAVCQYLGFVPYRDEGKLMGLAALGEERRARNRWIEPLSKVLAIGKGFYTVNPVYTWFGGHHYGSRFTDEFVKLLTEVDPGLEPVGYGERTEIAGKPQSKYLLDSYVDLAWAAQELLEQAALTLARKLVADHGVADLCLAGGVALNCKMNGEILRRSGCRRLFVQPAANDAGTALGAAMAIARDSGDGIRIPLQEVHYGPGFGNAAVEKALQGCGVAYRRLDDAPTAAAELLERGKILGWFQGRMEFGSRALGGRSILANPVFPGIKDRVNRNVKYREAWRPFCPTLAYEASERYLDRPDASAFMVVAQPAKPGMADRISSVVHVDGTIRPQAVQAAVHPRFHAVAHELGNRTGHPVVLNTSFNVRGEPIVCTPLDAIRCFYSNGLDALVIGDFLLEKFPG